MPEIKENLEGINDDIQYVPVTIIPVALKEYKIEDIKDVYVKVGSKVVLQTNKPLGYFDGIKEGTTQDFNDQNEMIARIQAAIKNNNLKSSSDLILTYK